jgi:NAD(P)-dependent dehydrogenase (short-subunit alcohol dehydrogenase family)
MGRRALALKTDISKSEDIRNLVKTTLEEFGRIDILVNNAAVFFPVPFLEISEEELDMVLSINLKGTFLLSQAVAKEMVKRRKGKIINVGAGQSLLGIPFFSHYASSKGGINALTRSMAAELSPYGIYVNVVSPGYILTDKVIELLPPEFAQALTEVITSSTPLGRLATPEECAGAALYLASDESNGVTGHIIPVDGGWSSAVNLNEMINKYKERRDK